MLGKLRKQCYQAEMSRFDTELEVLDVMRLGLKLDV